MKLQLISEALVHAKDIHLESMDAAFRKASINMAMATVCCQKALEVIPDVPKEQISVVMATHFGEISSTLDFLTAYHETHTARPILFQNSLHNSTLGFTTIQLGLTGPAMTVSADKDTAQAAMDLSESLGDLTPYVIVCFVDSIPDLLVPYYQKNFPFIEKYLNKAQCSVYKVKDFAESR